MSCYSWFSHGVFASHNSTSIHRGLLSFHALPGHQAEAATHGSRQGTASTAHAQCEGVLHGEHAALGTYSSVYIQHSAGTHSAASTVQCHHGTHKSWCMFSMVHWQHHGQHGVRTARCPREQTCIRSPSGPSRACLEVIWWALNSPAAAVRLALTESGCPCSLSTSVPAYPRFTVPCLSLLCHLPIVAWGWLELFSLTQKAAGEAHRLGSLVSYQGFASITDQLLQMTCWNRVFVGQAMLWLRVVVEAGGQLCSLKNYIFWHWLPVAGWLAVQQDLLFWCTILANNVHFRALLKTKAVRCSCESQKPWYRRNIFNKWSDHFNNLFKSNSVLGSL